jgi:type VI secretion system secreted protein VgrG
MTVIIEAGMQLSLKGPGGFVDIGPTGVTIQGTMVLINSGGAAGSGPGASPESPDQPTDPDTADDGSKATKL